MQIEFEIDGMRLTRTSDAYVTEGSKNFVQLLFTFSDDWDGIDKWALFARDNKTYEVAIVDGKCIVPYECARTSGQFQLTVVGKETAGDVIATTSDKAVRVSSNEFEENPTGSETRLTNTFLVDTLASVKDYADKAKEYADKAASVGIEIDKAVESAQNAATSEKAAKGYADEAKEYSENVNVFIPSVDADGVMTWTNKAGLANPAPVSVKGERGEQGIKGDTGATGAKGERGEQGLQGLPGAKGDKGEKGDAFKYTDFTATQLAALKGPQGERGLQGPRGEQGPKGDTGSQGPQGERGLRGLQGATGATGPQGERGPQGKQGATGAAGAAATIKVGTVTTGAAGTAAKVVNSGTTSAAVLDFTIPQGAKGDKGDQGEQGSGATGNYLPLTGGTVTGGITATNFQTGTATANYFQSRKFRGEGDANSYYHAIDFGYSGHDSVDFYEYDPNWNFYKCLTGTKSGAVLIGNINGNGWNGGARLSGAPTAPTAAVGTNTTQIATTAFVQAAIPTNVSSFTNDAGYIKTVNNTKPDSNGNVTITVSGGGSGSGVSTSTQNSWTALQSFDLALLSVEKYKTTYANGNSVKPSSVTAVYNATGNFTLDLTNFSYLLSTGQSLVFTAYIKANADYPLTITNGGTLKYIGSPSDLAITSAGLLLNIFITLDNSGNKTSIIQASKLS